MAQKILAVTVGLGLWVGGAIGIAFLADAMGGGPALAFVIGLPFGFMVGIIATSIWYY